MSGRRDMRTSGALVLAARIAASRFAVRRRKQSPRGAWLPVTLHWRQTRRRMDMPRDRRAATPASSRSVWLPQFHLHFAARASDRSRRDERSGYPSAAAIHNARQIVINRQWTSVRMHTLAMQSHRTHSQHVVPAGIAAVPKFHASETAARRWSLTSPAIVSPATYRAGTSVIEPIRKGIGAGTSRNERSHLFRTHAPVGHREMLVSRRPTLAESAAHRASASTPSHERIVRPPELVYRRELHPRTEIVDQPSRLSPAASSPRPPARSLASHETTPEVARSGRPAALRVTDLDPSLLDRLTDDVIRRVERRVRIERERRGL